MADVVLSELPTELPTDPKPTLTTGLAFSGGGIRSAAFCSGVLRRLLQHGVEPDYLSCVSGGGYTGTAYLDWKYRHGKKDDPVWHREFFEHMRSRTGLLCNWQEPMKGILDTLTLVLLVLLVSFVIPILGWGSFACPLAYFIDLAFGEILMAKRYHCLNVTVGDDCDFPTDSKAFERMLLFLVPLVFSIVCFAFSKSKCQWGTGVSHLMAVMSGSLVLYTFLPWFIHDYINNTPAYVEGGVVFMSALMWFFVPFLRHYSALVIVVYAYAYVVYWRVYEGEIFGVKYRHDLFTILLFVSGLVLLFSSVFGECHLHLVNVYNRWRLQKAFYTKKSRGKCGCAGIGCHDIFPGFNSYTASRTDESVSTEDAKGALNLAHLDRIKPQYISNIVINGWRLHKDKAKYGLLTMSPKNIERLDNIITEQPRQNMFSDKLNPGDVKLSEAMAASAAAVSTHMGSYEEEGDYKNILTILGLEMGASMVYNMASARRQNCIWKILVCLMRVLFVVPLLVLPILHFVAAESSILVPIGIGSYFTFIAFLSLPVMWTTGEESPGRYEKIARWLIINVPFSRFMRSILDVINTGPVPPAILHLSDGGHIENLALLPLLKQELQRIVVVNGGRAEPESYGDSLVHALELAREKLNCSFIGLDGRDVLEDIQYKFVNKPSREQPRSYRFRVEYYDKDKKRRLHGGEVILIAPRQPNGSEPKKLWSQPPCNLGDLETGLWGAGPDLADDEIKRLPGCCCECCHVKVPCCHCCVFPQHTTANQFFTPNMFAAYHREGYRACLEAEADVFLGAKCEHVTRRETFV